MKKKQDRTMNEKKKKQTPNNLCIILASGNSLGILFFFFAHNLTHTQTTKHIYGEYSCITQNKTQRNKM